MPPSCHCPWRICISFPGTEEQLQALAIHWDQDVPKLLGEISNAEVQEAQLVRIDSGEHILDEIGSALVDSIIRCLRNHDEDYSECQPLHLAISQEPDPVYGRRFIAGVGISPLKKRRRQSAQLASLMLLQNGVNIASMCLQ